MQRRAAVLAALMLVLAARAAQGQPYDPRLSFQTLETPHFLVHFHAGEEELAQRVGRLAERAHDLLVPLVGHEPDGRTQLTLVDVDDAANGYATPVPYNTIQLLAAAPDVRGELNRFEDWVWQLVVHEYTHILHLDTIEGPAAILNVLLGKQLSPNMAWPRWFTEGWAVHEESTLSRGGRLRSSLQDMQLRMHVLEGRPLTLATLSTPPLSWPRRSAWYLYGGRFVSFVAQRHGDGALREMSRENAGTIIPYFLGTIAERASGEGFTALYAAWLAELRTRYDAQAALVGTPTPEVRLTRGGEARRSPRFSRDGRTLYSVLRDADRKPRLLALDLATGLERTVSELNDDGVVAVAADGRLVIGQTDVFHGFESYEDLFVEGPARGRFEPVTRGARLSEPDVAQDGRVVAVQRLGPGRTAIVLFESLAAASGAGRVLAEGEELHPVASPRFSPDGTKVVYSLHRRDAWDLQLVDLATGARRDLTNDAAQDLEPAFSPDGARVLFSSDRTGIFDIYELDLATGDVVRRTRVLGGAFEPVERDGRLYYLRYGADGYDLARQDGPPVREAAPPPPQTPEGPVPPPAAEVTTFPVRPYSPLGTLRPSYWLPLVGADPAGTTVGVTLGGSDVLARYTWAASGFWSLGAREPGYSASVRTDALWPALTLTSSRSLDLVPGAPRGYVERTTGVRGLASWLFRSQYSSLRVDAGYQLSALSAARPGAVSPSEPPAPEQGRLASALLSLSYSSALRFERSISSEEGRRLAVDLRGSSPWLGGQFGAATAVGSWTEYLRLPLPGDGPSHHVLALRLTGGLGQGDLGGRQHFGLGGASVVSALDDLLGLQSPTRLLRGYRPNAAVGRAFVLGSAEYRFPLVDAELGYATFPLALRRLHGALFVDTGDAFSAAVGPHLRTGVGAELRFELVLGYGRVTDVRVGYARGLGAGGENQLVVLFGSGF